MENQMNVSQEIIDHYDTMLWPAEVKEQSDPGTGYGHLRWMLRQLNTFEDKGKAMRWLGFIQGVLIMFGETTVTAERDFTRGKFS
jgi:hypothetical protein